MKKTTGLVSVVICLLSCTASAHEKANTQENFNVHKELASNKVVSATGAFTKMKSLVGTWVREGDTNSTFNITFELTAKGSTLMETWNSKGKKHSLTVYHLNGENLMATHYCPQGNQPRLHLSKDSTLDKLSFSYLDATNLKSIDHSHQHSLGFEIGAAGQKVLRSESYLKKGDEDFSTMNLIRK